MTEITHTPPHANLRVADQAGQLACFNCVIETYQTQAYNLARRMLSDWASAEDALQENFVSAYRAFNRLRGEDLAAWVLRIVSNTCRDMLHARKSRLTVSLDPVPGLITEIKGGNTSTRWRLLEVAAGMLAVGSLAGLALRWRAGRD